MFQIMWFRPINKNNNIMVNNRLKHLTNGNDLRTLMKTCRRCSKSVEFGLHIILHKQLSFIRLKQRQTAFTFLSCNMPGEIGHWANIFVTKNNIALLCDGLNYVQTRPDVMSNIMNFCRNNNLHLKNLDLRCQLEKSSICGYVSMYMVYAFSHFTLKQFLSLEKLFKRNSIKTNEKLVLTCVQQHFKFKM